MRYSIIILVVLGLLSTYPITTYIQGRLIFPGPPGQQTGYGFIFVNGGWSTWSTWSPCYSDFSCEVGFQNRSRMCSNPYPANGGNICDGSSIVTRECTDLILQNARLVSGRLEVFCNGLWGTVCDDYFSNTDAKLACRMLGYENGVVVPANLVPDGSGPIWLDDLNCTVNDNSLYTCVRNPVGCHDCYHFEDVGVSCS